MLFGPTELFGTNLEMMLEISSLLVGDKKNDWRNYFPCIQKNVYVNRIYYISPCLFNC